MLSDALEHKVLCIRLCGWKIAPGIKTRPRLAKGVLEAVCAKAGSSFSFFSLLIQTQHMSERWLCPLHTE